MDAGFAAAATLFVALAMLQVGLFAWLRADMRRMEERLRADAGRTEERLRADIAGSEERLRADIAGLERRTEERFERQEAAGRRAVRAPGGAHGGDGARPGET